MEGGGFQTEDVRQGGRGSKSQFFPGHVSWMTPNMILNFIVYYILIIVLFFYLGHNQ